MTQANYSESNGSITVIATGGSTPYWYNWTGPNSFAGNNYTHADLPAGEYCVTVTENAANCEASDCIMITEIMPDPPVAAFSADVTEGCDNLTVQFTDESTNSPTTWAWDFGNGDTSDEQNPQYTYTTSGTYTVTLTVTNPGGSDDYFVTDMIVIGETPVLSLSMTQESLATGNDGTATVSITGGEAPYDINWTGGLDTETISGLSAGEYCVTVIEAAGCEAYDCINVALEGIDAPIANFSADETEACGTLTVQFSDLSANDPTTWEWDFGDGTATSSEANPNHTYSEPGTYTVSLTVTNLGGSNNLTLTDFIVVNEKPVLSFEITHESAPGAADGEVVLTITGGTEPYTINWSNNMHDLIITDLNAGLYSVAVIDANGCLASGVAEVTVSTEIANSATVKCNVYPNPSDGSFIVESNAIPEIISIKDALGRSIQTFYPIANKTEVNLEMSPGVYFIDLSIDGNLVVKKIIIK
jgi:PKD repeat protein